MYGMRTAPFLGTGVKSIDYGNDIVVPRCSCRIRPAAVSRGDEQLDMKFKPCLLRPAALQVLRGTSQDLGNQLVFIRTAQACSRRIPV